MSTQQKNPFARPTSLTETSLFCGVTLDANGNAVLPTAGAAIVGVMSGISGTGTAAVIHGIGTGTVKAQYGGTVTMTSPPPFLKVNSSGQFVTASATDVAAGSAVAIPTESGASGEIHEIVLIGGGGAAAEVVGTEDVVLASATPLSSTSLVSYLESTGTVSGAKPDGLYVGQPWTAVQSVAASTPVATVTGHFKTQAGVAKTTLALGTAVGLIFRGVWDGAAFREIDALGGSGSGLS